MADGVLWAIPIVVAVVGGGGIFASRRLMSQGKTNAGGIVLAATLSVTISAIGIITGRQDASSFSDFLAHSGKTTGIVGGVYNGRGYTYVGYRYFVNGALYGGRSREPSDAVVNPGQTIDVYYDKRHPQYSESGDVANRHRFIAFERFGLVGVVLPVALFGSFLATAVKRAR